ncbi:MAG: sterol desaturase family protein [Cyclobacteriaceae bacterium]|nr:sterol desaturase family protein [Cyclobacteriaceae bacterium]
MFKVLQYLFYPFVVLITLVVLFELVEILSVEYYILIPVILMIPLLSIFVFLELFFPYKKDWNIGRGDFGTDLIQTFLTLPIASKISELLLPLLLYYPIMWLTESLEVSIVKFNNNLTISFMIALLICEFCYYWIHRISHENKYLWQLHAIHHGAERVYWGNSGRFHFIDAFLGSTAYFLPLILLGVSNEVIVIVLTFSGITGFLEHVNINFRAGFLNYVFNTAELHRWHHSENEQESNRNYGKALILWDLLFRTFFWPKDRRVEKVGIKGEKIPVKFMKQLFHPFLNK